MTVQTGGVEQVLIEELKARVNELESDMETVRHGLFILSEWPHDAVSGRRYARKLYNDSYPNKSKL